MYWITDIGKIPQNVQVLVNISDGKTEDNIFVTKKRDIYENLPDGYKILRWQKKVIHLISAHNSFLFDLDINDNVNFQNIEEIIKQYESKYDIIRIMIQYYDENVKWKIDREILSDRMIYDLKNKKNKLIEKRNNILSDIDKEINKINNKLNYK